MRASVDIKILKITAVLVSGEFAVAVFVIGVNVAVPAFSATAESVFDLIGNDKLFLRNIGKPDNVLAGEQGFEYPA